METANARYKLVSVEVGGVVQERFTSCPSVTEVIRDDIACAPDDFGRFMARLAFSTTDDREFFITPATHRARKFATG